MLVLTPGVSMTATEAAWMDRLGTFIPLLKTARKLRRRQAREARTTRPRPRPAAKIDSMTNHPDLMKSGSGSVDEQHGRGLFGVDGDHGEAEGSTAGRSYRNSYVRGKRRADSRRTRDTGVETDDKSL